MSSLGARLLIHVEGETEEAFVNEVLAPHLYSRGYVAISARLVGNARQRDRRGGIRSWSAVRSDILDHLKEDPDRFCTTMVDYYALPQSGQRAWPGRAEAGQLAFQHKASTVEQALYADVAERLGKRFNPTRFLPFVLMHEFEALLFSDCVRFAEGVGRPELAPSFQAIREDFANPEEINDSPTTAPSKRVEALVPGYEKPLLGTLAALEVGLEAIRIACPHFHSWLNRLEDWPK